MNKLNGEPMTLAEIESNIKTLRAMRERSSGSVRDALSKGISCFEDLLVYHYPANRAQELYRDIVLLARLDYSAGLSFASAVARTEGVEALQGGLEVTSFCFDDGSWLTFDGIIQDITYSCGE